MEPPEPPLQPATPSPILPLEYSTPQPKAPPQVLSWIGQYFFWVIFGIMMTALLAIITPHFEQIFRDFKVSLPGQTIIWINLSRWFIHDFGWLFFWSGCLVMPLVIFLINGNRLGGQGTRLSVRATRRILFLLTALIIIWAILALFTPMLALVEAASSHR
jgi:hypothetical protein